MILCVASSLTAGIIYSEDFSTGTGGWACNGGTIDASSGALTVTPSANYKTIYGPSQDAMMGDLQIGEKLIISMDIKRGADWTGTSRISLYAMAPSYYTYSMSTQMAGSDQKYMIGRTPSPSSAPSVWSDNYLNSGAAAAVSTTEFETYSFSIQRLAANQLGFEIRRDGTLMGSATETYDDVDEPAANLMLDFSRIWIGWGFNNSGDLGGSFQIDNVQAELVVPEPATLTLFGSTILGLLVFRRKHLG